MSVPKPHNPHSPPLPAQPQPDGPPPAWPPPRGSGGEGTTSLICSLIAPASVFLSAPFGVFALLLTRPDNGRGTLNWVAPLVFWSFPLLFGLLSMTLAIAAIRGSPPRSNSHTCAVAGLWILGAGLVLGTAHTLRFLY